MSARNSSNPDRARYVYAVTGDFSRMIYSRHRTLVAASRAARALSKMWGWSHPGSEPQVVRLPTEETP